MYTREISKIPDSVIKNGKAMFGTFEGCPERLDIRGIRTPFTGLPLPRFMTNFRIKSSISFMFSIGNYIGVVDFFDQKIFGLAKVVFWSKENKRKFSYREIMGPRRRIIPHNMQCGFCASFSKNRYIRLSWDHKRNRFSMIFSLRGDSSRPSARAAFVAPYMDESMNEVFTVVPAPTKRRCSATYYATPSIHGTLSLGSTQKYPQVVMDDMNGFSIFQVNRAYYPLEYESESVLISGLTEINGSKKRFSLILHSTQENQVDADGLNSNFLFLDGKKSPLPQVQITHTLGLGKTWVIQDFENMVDLTFTPISSQLHDFSLMIVHETTTTIYGTFEWVLKTKDNEDIVLHNFEGLVRKESRRS